MIVPTLRVEEEGATTRFTLNRPEVRNCLNEALIDELHVALDSLKPSCRVLVITGAGDGFCAGGDLEWMRRAANQAPQDNQIDALKLASLFAKIQSAKAAVVVAVNGACFGGGCGIVAAADYALAKPSAKFAFSEVKLGLVAATISPFVLPKIGVSFARALFTSGMTFTAEKALQVGLVHGLGNGENWDSSINQVIKAYYSAAPGAILRSRQLTMEAPLSLETSAKLLAEVRSGEEAKEGIEAFLNKRSAKFVITG